MFYFIYKYRGRNLSARNRKSAIEKLKQKYIQKNNKFTHGNFHLA